MGLYLKAAMGLGVMAAAALGQPPAPAATGPAPVAPPAAPSGPAAPAPTSAPPSTPGAAIEITPAQVEVRGTGPVPMVLIPNLVCDWMVFEDFMERNKERYTMYAVTLPGFGDGPSPPLPKDGGSFAQTPWLDNAERAIVKIIELNKLDKPVVVGQSLGGFVALRIVAHHPDLVRSAVIMNGMSAWPMLGPGKPLSAADRLKAVDENLAPEAEKVSAPEWRHQQGQWIADSVPEPKRARALNARADRVPKAVSERYMMEYFASDLGAEVEKITTPLLVIAPAPPPSDPMSLDVHGMWETLYAPIKNTTLVYFEGSREFITEDSPRELDAAIDAFLNGRKVRGKTAGARQGAPGGTGPAGPGKASAPETTFKPSQEQVPKPAAPKPDSPKQDPAKPDAPEQESK